jgi:serine/threonine protein kinase
MHPPARPLWSLVERLGRGGLGEAWRARHDKTGEQRVFKFALEEAALVALKREITLYRVINDTLGENARVVKLLDWNLEQLPYFVEAEFVAGGSLVDWVVARGGAAGMPLSDRLEVVAKIADALGAVHSVGVLHKDLKPSNVLVKPLAGHSIDIVLADFGSGGVLDVKRLEALGITRLGFTKTIVTPELSSGTPLYLAPEIVAGQPFTVKSDIYALGIILYQFIVGDFHKVMSPGWERGIDDELLREDIALMAEGNPTVRLGDAEALARRLRTLDERRRQMAAQRDAQARAESTRRLMERAQARRLGIMLAFAALGAGLAVSTTLYFKARRAEEQSDAAAAQSKAVTEYLSKYVFTPVSSDSESVKGLTVLELLRRAGDEIDRRFQEEPAVASELHFIVGRSFQTLLDSSLAVSHFNRAMELGEHLDGEGSQSAMRSASELIQIDYALGQLRDHMTRYDAVLNSGEKRYDPNAREVLNLRMNIAKGHFLLGDWVPAAGMFQRLLEDAGANRDSGPELLGRAEYYYGQLLTDLARPVEATEHLHTAIDRLKLSLGEQHAMVAEAQSALGLALAESGHYLDAKNTLERAHELAIQWVPLPSWTEVRPRFFMALLFLQQDQPRSAEPILADIVHYEEANEAAYLQTHKNSTPELDHTGAVRQALGEAYAREGELAESIDTLQRAVTVSDRVNGPEHPLVLSTRLSLAESLLADRRVSDAQTLVGSIPAAALAKLPDIHPILAQWQRVEGLLALQQKNKAAARKSLQRAYEIYSSLYGPDNWRVRRAHQELQLAQNSGALE